MPYKVIHIGVFDRNIGDNIALINLQKSFAKYVPDVQFQNINLERFWSFNNNINETKKLLDKVSENANAILVGGGGLIEYATYGTYNTNYKLPFNREILQHIKLPVYFYGLGVNIFRGGIKYSQAAVQSLQETIDYSKAFAVRNDGSFDKLKNWIKVDTSKVEIVPDPGLLHLDRFDIPDKTTVTKGGVQPAFNGSEGINRNRFKGEDNLNYLRTFFKDYIYYSHTAKDFNKLGRVGVITKTEFENKYVLASNLDQYLVKYKNVDYVVAMRGHGQMITIGMNIPGIYLSTQDKVTDFSINNGFEDYNVDLLENDWKSKLEQKVKLLTTPDSEYLKRWYEIRKEFIEQCHNIDQQFFKKYFNGV